jgi:hypothetical protein
MQSLQSLCRADISTMVAETLQTLIVRYFSENKIQFVELVEEARHVTEQNFFFTFNLYRLRL